MLESIPREIGAVTPFAQAITSNLQGSQPSIIYFGNSKAEAIRLASVQRLRPKLMTASCAALGLLPILLSRGVGAEIEKPLAIVMIGGLVSSTLFTLLVLPAVYLALEHTRDRAKDHFEKLFGRNGRTIPAPVLEPR